MHFLLICKPCHTGAMLLASACSTSITMGNVPPKCVNVRSTRFSEQMHHTINSLMCRTKVYQSSFFPCTTALLNSLSNECFPPDYNLTAFKGRVNKLLLLKWPCNPLRSVACKGWFVLKNNNKKLLPLNWITPTSSDLLFTYIWECLPLRLSPPEAGVILGKYWYFILSVILLHHGKYMFYIPHIFEIRLSISLI